MRMLCSLQIDNAGFKKSLSIHILSVLVNPAVKSIDSCEEAAQYLQFFKLSDTSITKKIILL